MANTPVTLSRQWYSQANIPFTPTTADDCQKWHLWLMKQMLIGSLGGLGGTTGWEGARPASANWVVAGSSDGVGGFGNNDGVDRWVTRANCIRANSGTNHSWIVLKSTETGPNGALGFGQGPMWLCIDDSAIAGQTSADGKALIMASREAFTGGTATARPTSPKEFEGAMFFNTFGAPTFWSSTVYNVARYASISMDASGQFFLFFAVPGTGAMDSVSGLWENVNSDDRDLYRQHFSQHTLFNAAAMMCRNWSGSAKKTTRNALTADWSTSGGIVRWRFGTAYTTTTVVVVAGNGFSNGVTEMSATGSIANYAGNNPSGFGLVLNSDANGYWTTLPLFMLDYGAGYKNYDSASTTNNRPQWRGQVPDCHAIGGNETSPLSVGSAYINPAYIEPATPQGKPSHVVCPLRIAGEAQYLVPMTVQMIL